VVGASLLIAVVHPALALAALAAGHIGHRPRTS
jgi:hypothetical protein